MNLTGRAHSQELATVVSDIPSGRCTFSLTKHSSKVVATLVVVTEVGQLQRTDAAVEMRLGFTS